MGRVICALIRAYQLLLSPHLGGRCRFYPSCSSYAYEAFSTRPPIAAARLVVRRLMRCHPLGAGGFDPLPRTSKSR